MIKITNMCIQSNSTKQIHKTASKFFMKLKPTNFNTNPPSEAKRINHTKQFFF